MTGPDSIAARYDETPYRDEAFPEFDVSCLLGMGRLFGLRSGHERESDLRVLDLDTEMLPISVSDLPGEHSSEPAIFRAARELDPGERSALFSSLISLANRVAVADRMELGEAESLPKAIEKATRFASDGLEYLAEKNSIPLEEGLRRAALDRLFRVGVNLNPEEGMPPRLESSDDDPDEVDEEGE